MESAAETVHRETTAAKCATPVAQGFGKFEGIRSNMDDYASGFTSRERHFTESQQQIAAL
jgi:hypothetical protein